MAHLKKFGKSATGHMAAHFERAKDEEGEYIKFGNQDIDTSKTHLNYNLAPNRSSQVEFIKNRCSEVRCLNRADVKIMCSWVVTKPKGLETDKEKEFFKETYKFLENRYGKENVISAYVHMDENQPHMHFSFVPVVYDKKKELYKVSAKERVPRSDLISFHSDLEKHLEKHFGKEVGILNEATKEGNKSIEELKKGTAIKELRKIAEKQKNIENNIKPLENKKNQLEGEIKALEGKVLSAKEVESIKVKKTITGAVRGVSYDDILNLKKTAGFVNEAIAIKKNFDKRENELLQEKQNLEDKAREMQKMPLDQMMKLSRLEANNRELEKYKKAFEKLPKDIQEELIPQKQQSKGFERTR